MGDRLGTAGVVGFLFFLELNYIFDGLESDSKRCLPLGFIAYDHTTLNTPVLVL